MSTNNKKCILNDELDGRQKCGCSASRFHVPHFLCQGRATPIERDPTRVPEVCVREKEKMRGLCTNVLIHMIGWLTVSRQRDMYSTGMLREHGCILPGHRHVGKLPGRSQRPAMGRHGLASVPHGSTRGGKCVHVHV
jgi:hypothetical protein